MIGKLKYTGKVLAASKHFIVSNGDSDHTLQTVWYTQLETTDGKIIHVQDCTSDGDLMVAGSKEQAIQKGEIYLSSLKYG